MTPNNTLPSDAHASAGRVSLDAAVGPPNLPLQTDGRAQGGHGVL